MPEFTYTHEGASKYVTETDRSIVPNVAFWLRPVFATNAYLVEDDLQQVGRQDGRPAPVLEDGGGGRLLAELVLPVRPEEGGGGRRGGVGQGAVPAQLGHRLAVHVQGVERVEVPLVHPGKVGKVSEFFGQA